MNYLRDLLIFIIFNAWIISILYFIKGNKVQTTIQKVIKSVVYCSIFIIPILYYKKFEFQFQTSITSIIIGLIFILIFSLLQIKKFKPFFDKDVMFFLPRLSFVNYLLLVYPLLIIAIMEEIFFRYLLPDSGLLWINCLVSGILFSINHIWERVDFREHVLLFILGAFLYFLYDFSGSIIAPITVHLAYNLIPIIAYTKRYLMNKRLPIEEQMNEF
ncbi:CPBP family intramembrane glutamic endopeptidase [Bacillus cereus]|uniref:CPBP family intramembrane metalloprotease n=1 Tax=Bacillus cereus TaxID=1396 RepID=A0A9X8IVU1_BACCE|nr:CPBP family intramembrane metalloprotease [Bacillus cereus]